MKTYTVTFSDDEFWQAQQGLEERTALLERRRDTIAAARMDTTDVVVAIYAAGSALRRLRNARPNSPALSAMLTEGH